MATLSTDTIVDRWLAGLETGAPFYADGRRLAANGLVLSGPWRRGADLAEYLPAGRRRPRPLLLVTGDEWPQTGPFQTNLQWLVRMACARRVSELGADMAIIPFSALDSAGVIRSTIRPLEIRPDRETVTYEAVPFRLENLETAPVRRMFEDWHETGLVYVWPLSDGRRIERRLVLNAREYGANGAEWHEVDRLANEPMCYRSRSTWGDNVKLDLDSDTWRIVHRRHWLGDCVFTADVQGTRRRRREWTVADVVSAARDAIGAEVADTARAHMDYADGRYSYQTSGRGLAAHRRRLAAEVTPASRRLADVDIGAPIEWSEPVRRRRRFISSFDANEPAPLYYLATLPTSSRAETVADAELDLAPAAVHSAILRGRDVRRQGDIFLIETDLDDTAVYATCDRRARLTQWTRYAAPRAGEVGAYRPISARRWRRIRAETRATFRARTAETLAGARGPQSADGARRTARRELERKTAELERMRRLARGYVLKGDGYSARRYREYVAGATAELERMRLANSRLRARDGYRGHGTAAIDRRNYASAEAYRRHSGRPETSRDQIRETLAVYQTAHSATEVALVDGRPYVKGIVRHVPDLIGDRWRRAEHIPVKLPAGRWYLAVRNTVPRLDGR